MKHYSTRNIYKQNWLEENGILPEREVGKTAYYLPTPLLFSLLESYYIKYDIMIRR